MPSRRSGACAPRPGRRRGRGQPPRTRRGARPRSAATASTSSSGVAVGDMASKRTIAGVQSVTGWSQWLLAPRSPLLLALAHRWRRGAGGHGADRRASRGAPGTVFVGRVTTIVDDVVTFGVSEVRSAGRRRDDHRAVPDAVQRPRARGGRRLPRCPSVDPTGAAPSVPCGRSWTRPRSSRAARGTRHADGSPIDTGAFAGVGRTIGHLRGLDRRRRDRAPRPARAPRPLPRPPPRYRTTIRLDLPRPFLRRKWLPQRPVAETGWGFVSFGRCASLPTVARRGDRVAVIARVEPD